MTKREKIREFVITNYNQEEHLDGMQGVNAIFDMIEEFYNLGLGEKMSDEAVNEISKMKEQLSYTNYVTKFVEIYDSVFTEGEVDKIYDWSLNTKIFDKKEICRKEMKAWIEGFSKGIKAKMDE